MRTSSHVGPRVQNYKMKERVLHLGEVVAWGHVDQFTLGIRTKVHECGGSHGNRKTNPNFAEINKKWSHPCHSKMAPLL